MEKVEASGFVLGSIGNRCYRSFVLNSFFYLSAAVDQAASASNALERNVMMNGYLFLSDQEQVLTLM